MRARLIDVVPELDSALGRSLSLISVQALAADEELFPNVGLAPRVGFLNLQPSVSIALYWRCHRLRSTLRNPAPARIKLDGSGVGEVAPPKSSIWKAESVA